MWALRILVGLFLLLLALQWGGKQYVAREDSRRNTLHPESQPAPASAAAKRLHDDLLVADLHADSLLWPRNLLVRNKYGHVDLERLQRGNVAIQVFSAVTQVPADMNYEANEVDNDIITLLAVAAGWPARSWNDLTQRALYAARRARSLESGSQGKVQILRTRADLERLIANRENGGKQIGVLLALEGAHALSGEPANLERLFEAGYRMLGLAHFTDNAVSGSGSGRSKHGITGTGREVVSRAQELGMAIDASHASAMAVTELLAQTEKPIVFSHSGVKKTCPQKNRNLDDDALRALARNGGVVGIGLWERGDLRQNAG